MYRLAAWGYLNLISSATEYDVLDRIEGRIDYLLWVLSASDGLPAIEWPKFKTGMFF